MPHRLPQEFRIEKLCDARDEMHQHIHALINRIINDESQHDEEYLRFLVEWIGKYTDIDSIIESHTQSLIVNFQRLFEREILERDSVLQSVERLRHILEESRYTAPNTRAKA